VIWLILGMMLLGAAAVVVWPLYRHQRKLSLYSVAAILVVLAFSAGMYSYIGTPDGQSAESEMASMEEMLAGLDQRLRENPDDLTGWNMLARSYFQLEQYDRAIKAYERAVEIESASNAQTLVDLGEAIWVRDQRSMTGRASELFENALAIAPGNPKALFYGGLAAIERGERFLAAERWETLLATSPPEGIQEVLRQRVAELRGEEAPAQQAPVQETAAAAIVSAAIELAPTVEGTVDPNATVFVIAREPGQPRPPIAAVRRRVADLPTVVALSDSDAMIAGRPLSAFSELEIIARVSLSGQPVAQAGDWYGEKTIRPAESHEISIVIDQQVQ